MNQQFKPINSSQNDTGGIHIDTGTVASAVRTGARVAGLLSFFGYGFSLLPYLVPLGIGSLVLIRSCNVAPYMSRVTPPPPRHDHQIVQRQQAIDAVRVQQATTPQPQSITSPTTHTDPQQRVVETATSPRQPPVAESVDFDDTHNHQPFAAYDHQYQQTTVPQLDPVAEAALDIAADMYSDSPIGLLLDVVPDIAKAAQSSGQFRSNTGGLNAPFNFNAQGMSGYRGSMSQHSHDTGGLESTLAHPYAQPSFDGLWDSIIGRNFEGTCQFDDQPSKRIRLKIEQVRDRGTNIPARLTLLSGRRITKPFTGVIHGDPPRLTLHPKIKRGNIPMAPLYGVPWYSNHNMPPRITLYPEQGGFTGESTSGEQFELMPKESSTRQPIRHQQIQ